MKKNLSKIILIFTMIFILGFNTILFLGNKEQIELVDIEGNKNELENVNIMYIKENGLFNTKQVNINKDNVKIENLAKGLPHIENNELNSFVEENRDLYKNIVSYNSGNYKDKESAGIAVVDIGYRENNDMDFIFTINDKDLKSNKVKQYKMKIGTEFNAINLDYYTLATKYNGDIYVSLGINVDSNFTEDSNYTKETYLNIYKINLKNENIELVSSKKTGAKNDNSRIYNSVNFVKDNIFYYLIKKDDKCELVKYRIKENHFTSMEIPIKLDYTENVKHYLEDSRLTIININKENDKLKTYNTTINLTTNDIEIENVEYALNLQDSKSSINIEQIISKGEKIYLTLSEYNEVQKNQNKYIHVLNKNTKETLYTGKVEDKKEKFLNSLYLITDK